VKGLASYIYNCVHDHAYQEQSGKNHRTRNKCGKIMNSDYQWVCLIEAADRISQFDHSKPRKLNEVLEEMNKNLAGLLEVFPKDVDPLVNMEGYAVRQFIKTILNVLDSYEK
jgi:predicted amino acid racemase